MRLVPVHIRLVPLHREAWHVMTLLASLDAYHVMGARSRGRSFGPIMGHFEGHGHVLEDWVGLGHRNLLDEGHVADDGHLRATMEGGKH